MNAFSVCEDYGCVFLKVSKIIIFNYIILNSVLRGERLDITRKTGIYIYFVCVCVWQTGKKYVKYGVEIWVPNNKPKARC